jgi:archaellum component FlaC
MFTKFCLFLFFIFPSSCLFSAEELRQARLQSKESIENAKQQTVILGKIESILAATNTKEQAEIYQKPLVDVISVLTTSVGASLLQVAQSVEEQTLENKTRLDAIDSDILEMDNANRTFGETINGHINGVKNEVGTIKSDVGSIKNDVSTLRSDVGSVKSDVGTLKSDVGTLKSIITILNSLNTGMNTLNSAINTLNISVNSLLSHVESLALCVKNGSLLTTPVGGG